MKKILYLVLMCLLVLSISGCNYKDLPDDPNIGIQNGQIFYRIRPNEDIIQYEINKLVKENKLLDFITIESVEVIRTTRGIRVGSAGITWIDGDKYHTFDILINNIYYFEVVYEKKVISNGVVEKDQWSLYRFKELG